MGFQSDEIFHSRYFRIVAIITEALAVEVLPPESAEKQRVISIVKQVQVPILPLWNSKEYLCYSLAYVLLQV